MPYTLNKSDGTALLTVADGSIDSSRTITYVGKNYSNYGEAFNENFVKLQENFARITSPSAPLDGQLWYDKSNNVLKVYRGILNWTPVSMTTSVSGTANQITVTTNATTGAITLSTPQNTHTSATPTFEKLTLSHDGDDAPLTVTSDTLVANLNADLLDGEQGSFYLNYDNFTNTPSLGTISSQAASSVAITGGSIRDVTLTSGNATISGGSIIDVTFSSSNATITGGSISGITALAVTDGGTGATILTGVLRGNGTDPITTGTVSLATEIDGTLPIANGGTGATTRQAAMNGLAGAITNRQFLRGNGTNVVMSAIEAADVPTLNQSTTGSAGSVANSITFNDLGAGDVSGTTYNGAIARTISYNSVGAPSVTGVGASGEEWEISITGSANSANFADVAGNALGYQQDYRNTYNANTWYQNTSSRPILVVATFQGRHGVVQTGFSVTVAQEFQLSGQAAGAQDFNSRPVHTFVVPPDHYFRLVGNILIARGLSNE